MARAGTPPAGPSQADILVYGCTSGGVTSAIQARRMGKSVVMVCPERHLGGLTAGGLGWTDSGDKAVIGGLSREFYHRVWQHYQKPDAWRWQKREEYGNKGQGTTALDQATGTMWIFEPHVAEAVFEAWVAELKIPVIRDAWLDREKGVRKNGDRIASIATLDGRTYSARMFIDATLRRRPHGRGRRRLPRRTRVDEDLRRTVGRRPDRRAPPPPPLRRPEGACFTLRDSRRPFERPPPAHQRGPAGRVRGGRQEGAGLLLPSVPDAGARQSRPVPQARRVPSPGTMHSSCVSSMPAGARPSTSSTPSPT